jgi:hypothetical protein
MDYDKEDDGSLDEFAVHDYNSEEDDNRTNEEADVMPTRLKEVLSRY